MRRPRHRAPSRLALALLVFSLLPEAAAPAPSLNDKDKTKIPAVRWDETSPGCTFTRGEDGKYRYGMLSGDVDITMAVDSQELEKVRRRHEPFFSALLTVHYRGAGGLDLATHDISLEFVNHFHVVLPSLDPDTFAQQVQQDADEVDHEAARQVQKHPNKKAEKEAFVQAFQKDAAELLEFVSKNSLRRTRLSPANGKASGWVMFSADSKWISGWKKQEEIILRVPLDGKVFEFPFTLPPKPGEVLLRKRE